MRVQHVVCIADSQWADGVLIVGDLGRNSETAILLEKFVTKYSGQLTLCGDAIDYFVATPDVLLDRQETMLVMQIGQLQKLARHSGFTKAFTLGMDLLQMVDGLHDFTLAHHCSVAVKHLTSVIVAEGGMVSTTRLDHHSEDGDSWYVRVASHTSIWWLQDPLHQFAAVSSAIYSLL